ncbi:transposase [Streptomyces noursei]|uniref:transposase n=1 Tax=Streptomyces noursei TaxID=1971 RepID=UPI003558F25F
MTDAEWAAIRPWLPVRAWLQGRGGQPEGCCHRQMLDAVRYLVAGGCPGGRCPRISPIGAGLLRLLPPPARARADHRVPRRREEGAGP